MGRLNENATEVVTRARDLVFWPASVVAEVGDPVLVDAEVVGELVQDGDADLFELGRVGEVLDERPAVDGVLRGQYSGQSKRP